MKLRQSYVVPFLVLSLSTPGCSVSDAPGGGAGSDRSVGDTAGADTLTFRYFGAAGWEISAPTDGAPEPVVVLVDPYLTRAKYGASTSWDPADSRPTYTRDDTLFTDRALVDSLIPRADYILVQHAHPDHIMDVPYIALRTGAVVIGHETSINVMRAYGVPDVQLLTVRGGEDYDFGDVSIRAIPSLHSPLNDKRYYQSAVVEAGARRPLRINQLVEGGSLMFLVRLARHEVLTMGSMNYIEREVEGLRPDVALVGAAPSHLEIFGYTPRLMQALGFPPVVMPTHADNFQAPYGSDVAYRTEWVESFLEEMRVASPDTRLVVPRHLEPIPLSVR